MIFLPFPYNRGPPGSTESIILISGIPDTIPIIIEIPVTVLVDTDLIPGISIPVSSQQASSLLHRTGNISY